MIDFQICPAAMMAGLIDMNNFVSKFVSLWKGGKSASLRVESKSGRATVLLELDLGFPHPPPPSHPAPQQHHLQAQDGAAQPSARVRRHERRAAWRQEAERRAADDAATIAENASNDAQETVKIAAETAANKEEIAEKDEAAMIKDNEPAKKEDEAVKVSESADRDDQQCDVKKEAEYEAPSVLVAVGEKDSLETGKVARSSNISIIAVESDSDVIDTRSEIVEETVHVVLNFDDENTKVSDTITIDCEKVLNDNSSAMQGVDFVPPPAPPLPLGLLDPVENKFPWDSDVDFVCTPVTARKLKKVKRMLWKIVRNPDGTITALKNSKEIKTKKQDEIT